MFLALYLTNNYPTARAWVPYRNLPLISDYEDPRHAQRRLGSYYIASGNSTLQKKEWLDEINRRLEVGMTVIVDPKV